MIRLPFFKKKQAVIEDDAAIISQWEASGKQSNPPHAVKRAAMKLYRDKYNLKILVETGTYLGDMVEACKHTFDKVYSVELSEKLYKKATKRFAKDTNVELLCGDSSVKLPEILKKVNQPCLFWLDGHYSGGVTAMGNLECPVREELAAILSHAVSHVILVDDARLFNGTHDYPTVDEIKQIIASHGKSGSVTVEDDIIRITY
ncbi:MAG: hypothetical protein U0V75_06150 [Ferruginibacter sp.]